MPWRLRVFSEVLMNNALSGFEIRAGAQNGNDITIEGRISNFA